MHLRRTSILCGLLALSAIAAGSTARADQLYVNSTMTFNGSGTMEGDLYTSTGSRGIVFTTGSTGPFTIDLIDTVFKTNSGSIGDTYTFNIDVRNVSSSLPGTTLDATDTVTFTSAFAPGTNQNVNLTSADLTNISKFAFQSNTTYSVVFYHMTHSGSLSNVVAMERDSSHGPGTTVSYSDGFSNAGFFQNNNTSYTGSFPITLGHSVAAVPEPSTLALACLGSLAAVALSRRSLRRITPVGSGSAPE